MRTLTFAVDVDDVCLDLIDEWLFRYSIRSGHNFKPTDLRGWNFSHQVMPEWRERMYEILREPDLYACVSPIPGAAEAIATMRAEGHDVLFVSSCVIGSVDQKMKRLVECGFGTTQEIERDFIGCHQKHRITADVLIDDRVKNVEDFPGLAFLVTRPHNSEEETTRRRITGLEQALDAAHAAFAYPVKVPA